jgi:hypothetical protein
MVAPFGRSAIQHVSTLSPSGFACQHFSFRVHDLTDSLTSRRRRRADKAQSAVLKC